MHIKFWGVRGSLPAPLNNEQYKKKISSILKLYEEKKDNQSIDEFIESLPFSLNKTMGGNTSCVSVIEDNTCIILDAGSGIRELSYFLLSQHPEISEYHIFFSHLHWDHIIGLPFFIPIYMDNKKIFFYNNKVNLKESLQTLFSYPFFPVEYDFFEKRFFPQTIDVNKTITINNLKLSFIKALHPGGCINIKIENNAGKKIIYATDTEYKDLGHEALKPITEFAYASDIFIFDAQYSLKEAMLSKKDWGHSSNVIGIDIISETKAKKIVFFHHEPAFDDEKIEEILILGRKFKNINYKNMDFDVDIAYEGLEYNL